MNAPFTQHELCHLADMLGNDAYEYIMYRIPIPYGKWILALRNGEYSWFAGKWGTDAARLCAKLSKMSYQDKDRLTRALINYWRPFYKHHIEMDMEQWAMEESLFWL